MMRYLILIACALPATTLAATQHSTQYYFTHPEARVVLEMHCYPGSGSSATENDCRNAWRAGQRVVHSLVKAPASETGWGAVEESAAHAAGDPLYPNAPEEHRTDPTYWRLRGLEKIKDYTFYCPAHPTTDRPACMAAREAMSAPWHPTHRGR